MRKNLLRSGVIAMSFVGAISIASCGGNNGVTNDTLVIGMECQYQPFNWTVTEESEYTLPIDNSNEFADGYDIQVAKYLSEDLNKPVVIKRIVWDSLIPSLQQDEVNLVLAGMTDTPERRKSLDFTDPYLNRDELFQ